MKKACHYVMIIMGCLCWQITASQEVDVPAKKEITDVSAREKRQKLNGHVFVHRQDTNNVTGEVHDVWKVDGNQVSKEVYDELYEKARAEYKTSRRKYKSYVEEQQRSRVQSIKTQGALRLLDLTASEIEASLKKLDDKRLKPFYQFTHNTIVSQDELNKLQDEWLPQARKMLRSHGRQNVQDVNALLASVQGLAEKLSDFYLASLEHGIGRETDPQALKKWLSVVA